MLSISTTPRRSRGAALGLLLVLAAALAGCVGKSVKLGIIDQPENANGFVGGTATFYIGAQGPEPLTFQWKRNGTDIAGATNFSYTTPKLTLADHNAKFSVTISSGSNSLASSEATLTVYDVPTITTQPASQRVALGATATFSVAASGGGTLSYQWLRNDVAVPGATSTSFTTAATVAADDGAVYSVVVSNGAGGTASVQVPLVVTSTPSILLQPASQFATEGRAATFTVTGSGGDLAYEWRRGSVAIPGASSASYTTPALVAADSGAVYTVAITNPRGTVTSQSATLTVVAPAAGAPPALPAEIAVGKTTTVAEGFVIVRKSDGTAWSWGHNTAGYLGTGATGADTDTPVQVKIPSSRTVTRIAVGGLHALALLDNGDVYGWGSNASGQLAAGSDVTARSTPTKIALPRPAVAVAAGGDFSVAALDDGSVYAWGNNVLGQLGNGGRNPSSSPVKVGDFVSAVAVAAGNSHALALLADGRVYAWGAAALGQVGDGGVVVRRAPVQVASGIARIRAGADSSIAITTGRLVLAWGANASGQLGLGSAFSGNLVTPTGIAVDSVDAAAADSHLLVVASDGSVRGAGLNGSGEIGDGSKTARKTLTPATGLAGVLTAAAGGKGYSLSLGAGGTVHAWGNNAAKQLGNSSLSTDGTATPTQVPSFDAIP